jgi:predicted Mrr-cat superfamily restriction endonuclease
MASLTDEAKKKVSIWSNQYRIGDDNQVSGVTLLKIIIRESHLDTNATTNQIRTKLSGLDTYITAINSDIGRFNQYVKLLVQSLTARNQTTNDLLINLFKGYGAVSDEVFRAWLLRKQDDHEEGEELTPDELMQAAKNKYDTMV